MSLSLTASLTCKICSQNLALVLVIGRQIYFNLYFNVLKKLLVNFYKHTKMFVKTFVTYHVSRVPSGLHGGDGNDGGQNKRRHDLRLLVT